MTMENTTKLIETRQTTHGAFSDHARITQRLKGVLDFELIKREQRGQHNLSCQQLESIEMIFHKIGRIVAGDPNVADHWDDIAGYAWIANKVYT